MKTISLLVLLSLTGAPMTWAERGDFPTEAERFAQELVDRFPESREVKGFGGGGWMLPDPSNSERPQKRKLRRWGADRDQ